MKECLQTFTSVLYSAGGGGRASNYVSPFLKTTRSSISVLQLNEKQVSGPGHSGSYIAVTGKQDKSALHQTELCNEIQASLGYACDCLKSTTQQQPPYPGSVAREQSTCIHDLGPGFKSSYHQKGGRGRKGLRLLQSQPTSFGVTMPIPNSISCLENEAM